MSSQQEGPYVYFLIPAGGLPSAWGFQHLYSPLTSERGVWKEVYTLSATRMVGRGAQALPLHHALTRSPMESNNIKQPGVH